jgi:hypothetical protein
MEEVGATVGKQSVQKCPKVTQWRDKLIGAKKWILSLGWQKIICGGLPKAMEGKRTESTSSKGKPPSFKNRACNYLGTVTFRRIELFCDDCCLLLNSSRVRVKGRRFPLTTVHLVGQSVLMHAPASFWQGRSGVSVTCGSLAVAWDGMGAGGYVSMQYKTYSYFFPLCTPYMTKRLCSAGL